MEQNIEKFDLTIIGASLAGNYLSYLLSNSGLNIAVIEEHDSIGIPFQCAGIVSKKLGELIDLPKEIVLNRVKIAKIVAPSGKFIRLSGDEKPYIVDRIALDRLFYEKIKNHDKITYFLGEKFKSFSYTIDNRAKAVLIETSKRKLKTKMLIGCDGPLSAVGRNLDVKNKVIYASQVRIKGSFNQDEAVMFFDPRWKELFGWIVPEGNNVYRIGLGSERNVAKNFKIFLKKLKIDVNQKIDQQGGTIPYGTMNKVAFDNVLLLGDSAGQVKATTGGGIVMLLTAAKFAADCIKKCFRTNNFSKRTIKKNYEKPCLNTVGKQLKIHFIIRMVFENFVNDDYEDFFQIVKTSNIEQIIALYGDMDFPRTLFHKLLKNSMVFKFLLKFLRKNPLFLANIIKILITK